MISIEISCTGPYIDLRVHVCISHHFVIYRPSDEKKSEIKIIIYEKKNEILKILNDI